MIMPYHLELEKVTERFLGKNALGTTKRGIGPAYGDKAARIGLRIQDLFDEKIFREKLDVVLREKNLILTKIYNRLPLDPDRIVEEYMGLADRHRADGRGHGFAPLPGLDRREARDVRGGAGRAARPRSRHVPVRDLVDPVAASAFASAGLGPRWAERIVGIMKAYITRVGAGPFPTELVDDVGERLGTRGKEFGTVTGRKRRCGWFDACLGRYAARLNGLTELLVTKLDVLSGLETVKICTGYRAYGQSSTTSRPTSPCSTTPRPIYEELEGWHEEIDDCQTFEALPKQAQAYVRRMEELVASP